ncbi:MAG: hypothetical protein KC613_18465, partial [Myxococcales bacterium]|nr:hypothetical protein [Myxococcales bacterium]
SDMGLLLRLWASQTGMGPQCKAVVAAVLSSGQERGGQVVASFDDVARLAETTDRTLRRMRARDDGAPVLVWQTGSVGVDLGALHRTLRPDAPSENGRSVRTLRPKTDAPSGGTVLESRAQGSLLASEATLLQHSPPTPQGVAAAGLLETASPAPDFEEQGERIGHALATMEAPGREGVADAFHALLAEFGRRGGISGKQIEALTRVLAGESTATIRQLAVMLRRGHDFIRNPVGYITRAGDGRPSLLDEARAFVVAEAAESERVQSSYTLKPDGSGWETPEQRQMREWRERAVSPEVAAAKFGQMIRELGDE